MCMPPLLVMQADLCLLSVQHGNGHTLQGWCRAGKLAAAGPAGLVLCNPLGPHLHVLT